MPLEGACSSGAIMVSELFSISVRLFRLELNHLSPVFISAAKIECG
jgi:hypothetical protein